MSEDRTIFIPKPGGRSTAKESKKPAGQNPQSPLPAQRPAPSQATSTAYSTGSTTIPDSQFRIPISELTPPVLAGPNPLLRAASTLLTLGCQLRTLMHHDDVSSLRQTVIQELNSFEANALAGGVPAPTLQTARYIVCTYLDEVVLNCVWGSNSIWSSQSLLISLYNDAKGGEAFFLILDRIFANPNASKDLVELMYACLSLGFQGQYAYMDRGREKLEEIRTALFQRIRNHRGSFSDELSPNNSSALDSKKHLRNLIPFWVVAAVAAAILLTVFLGFNMILNNNAAPVKKALENIAVTKAVKPQDL